MTKKLTSEHGRIFRALGALALTLGEEASDDRLELYTKILAPYAAPDIIAAIGRAAETLKFFPTPSEIIGLIKARQREGEKDPAVAWEELLDAIETHGYTSDVQFDDGAIAAAIRGLGGWEYLCDLSDKEMTYQKLPARFQKLYQEAARAGHHRAPGLVYGALTRENRFKGLDREFLQPVKRARTMAEIMAGSRPRPALPQPDQGFALVPHPAGCETRLALKPKTGVD